MVVDTAEWRKSANRMAKKHLLQSSQLLETQGLVQLQTHEKQFESYNFNILEPSINPVHLKSNANFIFVGKGSGSLPTRKDRYNHPQAGADTRARPTELQIFPVIILFFTLVWKSSIKIGSCKSLGGKKLPRDSNMCPEKSL